MRVFHIDCSVRKNESISRQLSGFFVEQLKNKKPTLSLDYLDLTTDAPEHVSDLFIQGNYCQAELRTEEMINELAESDKLINRLHAADVYVIGMPMYNFSIPSNFKAFIDNVVRTGRTFKLQETGFQGLLMNKKVFVINTRGVDFSHEMIQPMDQLIPYLKTIFHFIGLDDAQFINVFPVKFGPPEMRTRAVDNAKFEITTLVNQLL